MQNRQQQFNEILFHGNIAEDELCSLMLHPEIDLKANESYALSRCALFQFNRALQLAIPLSDPFVNNSEALSQAAQMGNVRGVELLLPVSNALANNSHALQEAYINMCLVPAATQKEQRKRLRCFELLYRASDPHAALYALQQRGVDPDRLNTLEEKIALDLKHSLEKHIPSTSRPLRCKKV